jgi:probable rRNA maturation factor
MIHYRNDVRRSGIDGRALKRVARELLAAAGEAGASLSLWVVGDAKIRMLNRAHRGKDKPTDVLSFPGHSERSERMRAKSKNRIESLLGDVVISEDTAKRQAAEYDAPLQREVERLLIHGILHLLGHDHVRPAERKRMRAEERRLAERIGMAWPY